MNVADWLSLAEKALVALGGLTLILSAIGSAAYAFMKYFGDKIITDRFERSMSTFRNDLTKDLESWKSKLGGLADRSSRLRAKEFELLPDAWSRLVDAHSAANGVLASLRRYPDLTRMHEDQIDEVLEKSPFSKSHRNEIRNSPKKDELYRRYSDLYELAEAKRMLSDAHFTARKSGVFMRADIRALFNEVEGIILHAISEYEINERTGIIPRPRNALQKYLEQCDSTMNRLEDAIRSRLWEGEQL